MEWKKVIIDDLKRYEMIKSAINYDKWQDNKTTNDTTDSTTNDTTDSTLNENEFEYFIKRNALEFFYKVGG